VNVDPLPPLHRDDVVAALRALDSTGRGVRVAEIVRHCYSPDDIRDRYEKCHRKVWQRLCDLESEQRARRVGSTPSSFSEPARLWRAV
jgi:hypothetical protein